MEPRPAPIATDTACRAQAEGVKLGYSDMIADLGPTFLAATCLPSIVARNPDHPHACAVLPGVVWGYAGWAFYPIMSAAEHSLLVLVLAGITAGATRSLRPILPACWSFQVLTLAPLMLRLLLGASIVEKIMGVLIVLYMAFLVAMARSYHRSLSCSLRLGFEYESLVRDLGDEIGNRKQIESELRTRNDGAGKADQAKGEFLATMTH